MERPPRSGPMDRHRYDLRIVESIAVLGPPPMVVAEGVQPEMESRAPANRGMPRRLFTLRMSISDGGIARDSAPPRVVKARHGPRGALGSTHLPGESMRPIF